MHSKSQQIHQGRLQLVQGSAAGRGNDHVVAALPAAGACQQLGGEGCITAAEATLAKQEGQGEIGVSPLAVHSTQRVESSSPGPIRPAASLRPGSAQTAHSTTEPGLDTEA